jgi:hypothetical protein
MLVFENRAATLLYKFLLSNPTDKKFLLPCNVCPVIPLTFLKAGFQFEFCDIEPVSYCISKEQVLIKLTQKPDDFAGILYVRTYGSVIDQDSFFLQIKAINPALIIIDDKCLSIPEFDDQRSICDLILFSTGYAKFADMGYGGYGFITPKMNYIQSISKSGTIVSETINLNFRAQIDSLINSIHCKSKFKYIDNDWLDFTDVLYTTHYNKSLQSQINDEIKQRSVINSIYEENLSDNIKLAAEFQNWRYNILVMDKNRILKEIFNQNLFASSHYQTIAYAFTNESFEVSDIIFSKVINLFNNQKVTIKMANKLCEIINNCL